jgi:ankyrin repeat protein
MTFFEYKCIETSSIMETRQAARKNREDLHNALKNNNKKAVFKLLDKGIDLNFQDDDGYNTLHIAAVYSCSRDIFVTLIDLIDDVNAVTKEGKTALMIVAQMNRNDLVIALMNEDDIDPNVQDKSGNTALCYAVMYNENIDIVKSLLFYEIVNTSLENFRGKTPLDMAIQYGRDRSAELIKKYDETRNKALIEAIKDYDERLAHDLLEDGTDPNKVDDFGYNALHVAAQEGCSQKLFRQILRKISNVNAVTKSGKTALMIAAQNNRPYFVKELMKRRGVNLNLQDTDRYTALHHAVIHNHPAIVSQLLTGDINTTIRNPLQRARQLARDKCAELLEKYNIKTLHTALASKNEILASALLDIGTDPNADRNNALHVAAKEGCSIELFRQILRKINDVNAANYELRTALMLAAWKNKLNIVKELMNHPKIDVNLRDRTKSTALHWAVWGQHNRIVVQLLKGKDIDVSLRDQYNRTPLDSATRYHCKRCEMSLEKAEMSLKKAKTKVCKQAEKGVPGCVTMLRF